MNNVKKINAFDVLMKRQSSNHEEDNDEPKKHDNFA